MISKSYRIVSLAMATTLVLSNIATVSVNAKAAPKAMASSSSQTRAVQPTNVNSQNILNVNGIKDNHMNQAISYGQNVKLGQGKYQWQVILKKYYSSDSGLDLHMNIVCAQAKCKVNGEIYRNGEQIRSTAHGFPGVLPENKWKTFSRTFSIKETQLQQFRIQFQSLNGDELDIKEINIKKLLPNGSMVEMLKNTRFEESVDFGLGYRKINGWTSGGNDWGFRFTDVVDNYPGANNAALLVSTSTRVHDLIVRYETPVVLNAGNTYYFDYNAKSNIVKGRGVKIALSCAQADGCGHLANNQDLNNFNVPVTTTLSRTATAGFMVPESGQYYVRIYVNDGSEAIFDYVKLKSWENGGQTINANADFTASHNTTKQWLQPKYWSKLGDMYAQVGGIH